MHQYELVPPKSQVRVHPLGQLRAYVGGFQVADSQTVLVLDCQRPGFHTRTVSVVQWPDTRYSLVAQ